MNYTGQASIFQLSKLEDKSLSDLVHVKGYLSVYVCVLEKDDIFINWSLWSVVGPIVLPHL